MESFPSAVRLIRKRLRIRQADLAKTLGCKQNTVSQYESGKLRPSPEVLARLWEVANDQERRLLQESYLFSYDTFAKAMETQFGAAIEILGEEVARFMESPEKMKIFYEVFRGERLDREAIRLLSEQAAPEFLGEIISLYGTFRKYPWAAELFAQAASWLRVQLQMTLEKQQSD